ncbi:hypothetical protein AJ78_02170 [Emergomyces pasteurianus Ep9510]|uniref:Uncharacterized protein n=1 Tax=Emergomyces pasteurianus Ep9510 TaxID=1447872 RepID=A0A1J9PMU1_9EURO|nr:hypothetical protein AJ78_02170 [Emergomyces pasteurianus Ep9510]
MATLQASLRRSSFTLSPSYKPSLITVIQPSRPAQRRFINRAQASSFTAASCTQKEAPQKVKGQDRSELDPNSTENTNSGTHREVASQQTAFDPSITAPESELEETRQESAAWSNSSSADTNTKDAGRTENKSASNPLEMSPANRNVSTSKDEGVSKGKKKEPSKRSSPPKGKQV